MIPPFLLVALSVAVAPPPRSPLADGLRNLAETWPRGDSPALVLRAVGDRLRDAGKRESRFWATLSTRAEWENYRDVRLGALRRSLGSFPQPPSDLRVRVRTTLEGDGVLVECLSFTSRPGVRVTANLYRPAMPVGKMPAFLLVHSHHAPKGQGELQDMGVMWARAGCVALVMDQLGHGERRQHPFRTSHDYPTPFRVGRQDYYFRHNVAMQLQTEGDSLMGWMVWDIQRGVDLLLARKEVDAKKIVLLGAVAGGGDPAAVAGALDRRVAVVGPFNFGGPQPESRYPLPADAEASFLYTGSGSWESTRNLARSAKDGFLPWVIAGAIAPGRHLYGHEFSWDEPRDPVWKRLRTIHAWYRQPGHLASATGTGVLTGRPPAASHCTNIGPVQRKGVHEALKQWFGLPIPPRERQQRWPAADLAFLTPDKERLEPLHQQLDKLAAERLRTAQGPKELPAAKRRERLRDAWGRILGEVEPVRPDSIVQVLHRSPGADVVAQRVQLTGKVGVKALVLRPGKSTTLRRRAVVAVAQGGVRGFLTRRAPEIAHHLQDGTTVVLVELGGLSGQMPGRGRGRGSAATDLASSQLMLGEPALGVRLRELRTLLAYLRTRADIDPARLSLRGDSFAPVNAPQDNVARPLDVAQPHQAEPLGGILALLAGLFEDRIAGIDAHGGLVSYRSLLASPFVHVPYDVIVPGALTAGDLPEIAKVLPMRVRLRDQVDGVNRRAR